MKFWRKVRLAIWECINWMLSKVLVGVYFLSTVSLRKVKDLKGE